MRKLFSLLLALFGFTAQAQVTFKITALPANTPANAPLYIAGTFNGWNPGSAAAHALTRNADGSYQITLPAATGTVEYKFTRGSGAAVETNASNGSVPNRSYTFGTAPATVLGQVLDWEDLAGPGSGGPASTAAANVRVISTTFAMPPLGRVRRVWLYLPPGYATSGRRHPVLYLQDGQNVFDAATSFAGEWGVDEALNLLATSGQDPTGCIVVAVDNGPNRLDEYSPWNNPQYGGGQGDLYVDFLVQTLKPYIDINYRTLPDRANTGIGGVPAANLGFGPRADGQHAEWFWKREFPAGYSWLYAPATATAGRPAQTLAASLYPTPAACELRVSLPANTTGEALLEISDARGRTVLRTRVRTGQVVDVSRLAAGLYLSRLTAGGAVGTGKFTKE